MQLSTGASQWDTPTHAAPTGPTPQATPQGTEHPYGLPGENGSQGHAQETGGDGTRGFGGENAGGDGERGIGVSLFLIHFILGNLSCIMLISLAIIVFHHKPISEETNRRYSRWEQ